jgi:hypothetical protein
MTVSLDESQVVWEPAEVRSPRLERPVPVVRAGDIPYIVNANRLSISRAGLSSTSTPMGFGAGDMSSSCQGINSTASGGGCRVAAPRSNRQSVARCRIGDKPALRYTLAPGGAQPLDSSEQCEAR